MASISEQLVSFLLNAIEKQARDKEPLIPYYLNNQMDDSMPRWLQLQYAREVRDHAQLRFLQQVNFSGTFKYCDLYFQGEVGAPMWIDLKVQSDARDITTVNEFVNDIQVITGLQQNFKAANVIVALAVTKLYANDANTLDNVRQFASGGTAQYLLFTGGIDPWQDVTNRILTVTTPANQFLVAAFTLA